MIDLCFCWAPISEHLVFWQAFLTLTSFNPTSSGFAAVEESGKTKLIFTNYTSNTSPVSPTSNKVLTGPIRTVQVDPLSQVELVSWDVEAQTADILVSNVVIF